MLVSVIPISYQWPLKHRSESNPDMTEAHAILFLLSRQASLRHPEASVEVRIWWKHEPELSVTEFTSLQACHVPPSTLSKGMKTTGWDGLASNRLKGGQGQPSPFSQSSYCTAEPSLKQPSSKDRLFSTKPHPSSVSNRLPRVREGSHVFS